MVGGEGRGSGEVGKAVAGVEMGSGEERRKGFLPILRIHVVQ